MRFKKMVLEWNAIFLDTNFLSLVVLPFYLFICDPQKVYVKFKVQIVMIL